MASRLFKQDVEGAAEASRIERGLMAVDDRLQAVEPLGFHRVRYLILHVRARRSGPRRVFEGEGAGVADLVEQRQRRAKILLALAGEADDEVGRERHPWLRGAYAREGF